MGRHRTRYNFIQLLAFQSKAFDQSFQGSRQHVHIGFFRMNAVGTTKGNPAAADDRYSAKFS
jgi:hypothetical protein